MNEYAKPGDTIISNNTTAEKRNHLLVVERPIDKPNANDDEPGCAWFLDSNGTPYFLRPGNYIVVGRAGESHCKVDVDVELDVEASMNKRRDDIFREVFG